MKPSHLESLSKLLRKNRETLSSLERALKMPEWNEFETMGIGVLLSDIYQGVEQILVMLIEKVHSRKLVKDESWHDTLLSTARQMELIPEEIQRDLRGMLRYRHVQRHGYGIDLDGGKICPAPDLMDSIKRRYTGDQRGAAEDGQILHAGFQA